MKSSTNSISFLQQQQPVLLPFSQQQLWLLKLSKDKPQVVAAVDYADPLLGKKLLGEAKPVLEYPCWAAPVVSHGLLYLRGKDRLICLKIR